MSCSHGGSSRASVHELLSQEQLTSFCERELKNLKVTIFLVGSGFMRHDVTVQCMDLVLPCMEHKKLMSINCCLSLISLTLLFSL